MAGYAGLTGVLELRVRKALVIAFDWDSFDDLVLSVGPRLSIFTSQNDTHEKRVKRAVTRAYREGWLVDLMEAASKGLAGDIELQAVYVELRAKLVYVPPENLNHFQACCLNGGHIMVDRDSLRLTLEKLYNPRERRIMVVNDAPQALVPGQRIQTGKSHTRKLIAHLRQEQRNFSWVDVDLETIRDSLEPPKLIMPDHVAESIVSQMGYPASLLPKPPVKGQWARWVVSFCDRFVARADKDKRLWWVVIDSFNVVLVSQETRGLINDLARRVNDMLGNVRMILLGYDGTFHPSVRTAAESVKPFGEDELIKFFTRAFKEKQRVFTEDDVADSVVRVLEGADPAMPDFVPKASSLILAELERP